MKKLYSLSLLFFIMFSLAKAQDGSIDPNFNPINLGFETGAQINGNVFKSVIQEDGKVILGGSFTTYNGFLSPRLARLNPDGSLDTTFNVGTGFNAGVRSITIQNDGKIIVGGEFAIYNGVTSRGLVRLNNDGSVDTTFDVGSGFNDDIWTTTIQDDGKIIVGGAFGFYNGMQSIRLARLNPDGSLDTSFDGGSSFNDVVYETTIQDDGKIIIGGSFTAYNGILTNRIVRLNTDGTLDTTFDVGSGFNNTVFTTVIQDDGKIILGGSFTSYSGNSTSGVVRLNTDGNIDTTFNVGSGFNNTVFTTVIQDDGKVIFGGVFTTYNGTFTNRIVRLNSDGTVDTTFSVGTGFNSPVYTATIQSNGKIFIGGTFSTYNGTVLIRMARINSDGSFTGLPTRTVTTGTNATVYTTAVQSDEKIILGGEFINYNGVSSIRLVRLNSDGSVDTSFNTGSGFNGTVYTTLVQDDGKIIVGGIFTTYNGTSTNRIVRLNTDGSIDTTFNTGTGFNTTVFTTAIQNDGKIIVGGQFAAYNGVSSPRLVRLNADGSIDTTFDVGTGLNNIAYTTTIQDDGKIIIGGGFSSYNGMASPRLVRLNSDGSLDATFNVGTGSNNTIRTVAIQNDGKLIAGGDFGTYNGIASPGLVRLNSDGSLDTSFNTGTGFNNNIYTTTIQSNGKIIVGGVFNVYNGISKNRIARLNTNGTLDRTFNISHGFDNAALTLTIQNDDHIIVGGTFTDYNGTEVNRITRLIGSSSFPATGDGDSASVLSFDGIGDFVNCGIESAFDFNEGAIEAWIKPSSSNFNQVIIGNRTADGPSNTRWSIHVNERNNTFGIYNGTNFLTLNVGIINPNTWYHVAFIMNATQTTIYVNGVDRGTINIGINTTSTGNLLLIGASDATNSFPDEYFEGTIDEVRIWSKSLLASEIQANYQSCELTGNQLDLVANYKFNQGVASGDNSTETVLNDISGNDYNGNLVGFTLNGSDSNWIDDSPVKPNKPTVTASIIYNEGDTASPLTATVGTNGTGLLWYTSATGGVGSTTAPIPNTSVVGDTSYWVSSSNDNGCESERVEIVVTVNALVLANTLNFDGVNDYINLGDTIEALGDCTFESWINLESGSTNVYDEIISKTHVNSLNIWRAGGNKIWFHLGNGTNWFDSGAVTSDTSIPEDEWTHIAVTWDESTSIVSIYINGVLDKQQVHTHSLGSFIGNSSFSRGVGGYPAGSAPSIQGFKGDIDEVRVWNRVRTLEEIRGSRFCELQGNEIDLLAYYKFNQGFNAINNSTVTTLTDATSNNLDGTLNNFTLTGIASNWITNSPTTIGSVISSNPLVTTPVTYNQNDTASPLMANIGSNGTGLLWYTTPTGGIGSTIAPIPSTASIGSVSYWVSSTNDNGCESNRVEIIVTVDSTLSNNDTILNSSLDIYPNPTEGIVYIINKNNSANINRVEVYDLKGRLILERNTNNTISKINIIDLASGVYLLKIKAENDELVKRIVKN